MAEVRAASTERRPARAAVSVRTDSAAFATASPCRRTARRSRYGTVVAGGRMSNPLGFSGGGGVKRRLGPEQLFDDGVQAAWLCRRLGPEGNRGPLARSRLCHDTGKTDV